MSHSQSRSERAKARAEHELAVHLTFIRNNLFHARHEMLLALGEINDGFGSDVLGVEISSAISAIERAQEKCK